MEGPGFVVGRGPWGGMDVGLGVVRVGRGRGSKKWQLWGWAVWGMLGVGVGVVEVLERG